MNKTEIVNAWATIRKENNSITDEVLDFMKDAAIEKLQSISQPKGAEESWEEMRKALNCMEGSDWDIFCMKNNIYAAMQSFASQQCAEKDKEIAELKKSQQPEVSEDRMKVLDILLFDFGDDYFRQGGPKSLFSFSDWRKKPKVQKLYSQLFEPQPVQGESDLPDLAFEIEQAAGEFLQLQSENKKLRQRVKELERQIEKNYKGYKFGK
jgi:hypothetical protein